MPESLRLERKPNGAIELRRISASGETLGWCPPQSFDKERHLRLASKQLGLSMKDLTRYVVAFKDCDAPERCISLGGSEESFRVRGEQDSNTVSCASFAEALATQHGGVIEWDSLEACSAVDLDAHTSPLDVHELCSFAECVKPRPAYWWITRGGGLRLIYLPCEAYSAYDLACVAALACSLRFPLAGLEVNKRTRFPPGDCCISIPDADTAILGTLYGIGGVDAEAWAAYLADRGMTIGGRYPHMQCPGNPSPRAQSNSDPVCVYEDHIYCYICAADGLNSRFDAGALVGGTRATMLARSVANFTHWDHARYVLAQAAPALPPLLAHGVYAALLRRKHGDDPRVSRVFTCCEARGMLRFEGYWATTSGEALKVTRDSALLSRLPATCYVEDGACKPDAAKMDWFSQGVDLSPLGYPSLVTVWGVQVSANLEPPAHRVYTVLPTQLLRPDSMESRRPKYLLPSRRMPEEQAWARIEEVFPGINRSAVKLLIACKGLSELGVGVAPMVFFTGPTGAGKTAGVKVASAIAGDNMTTVTFGTAERVRAGLLDAKRRGTYAVFDEFLKAAKESRAGVDGAMEMLLNFTPDSTSHILYVGPVALGSLPVMVWCDTMVPDVVKLHAQLARRLAHVHLPGSMQWEHTLRDSGIVLPEELRVRGSAELLAACDSVLSCVIDEHFPLGATPPVFEDVVRSYGFAMLKDSDLAGERHDAIRRLYALVCAAPDLTGEAKQRWRGKGYKLVDLERESELAETWRALADSNDPSSSRAVSETDLKTVLALRMPAKLDARAHGRKVVVRFIDTGKAGFVNAELSNDGHRDAERGGLEEGREQSVSEGQHNALAFCGFPAARADDTLATS